MALFEIPTGPSQRRMSINLGGTLYQLRLAYADAPDAGWFMDIDDVNGNPILCGVALVTGADLLAPYPDLGIAGSLLVVTDQVGTPPTYAGLGTAAHLVYADASSAAAVATYLSGFVAS